MNRKRITNWTVLGYAVLGFLAGIFLGYFIWGFKYVSATAIITNGNNHEECQDVSAPDPETFEENVAKRGTVMATFKWFEEPKGTWTLKLDVNPVGGKEGWVTEYPRWWGLFFTKPVELPQTQVEKVCPSKDKTVTIVEDCDGNAIVTIYGGNTRRTWQVNGEKKWVEKYATVEWETTVPVTVEWWHENSKAWKLADDEYITKIPAENCEVSEEPVVEPKVEPLTEAGAPNLCQVAEPTLPLANFHVYRLGDEAQVKWLPEDKDWTVSIYYKQVDSPFWQYSLVNTENDGFQIINGLGGLDITFAGQYINGGCAGGPMTSYVVDGASNSWILFRP